MVFELHIWGPAFELPSIDAQCLATILYLRQCLQPDSWVLIPSSDARVSPLGELPALCDGETWVAGFTNIVDYLREISNGERDLNKDLSAQQQADCAAFSAFITSRGQPLLDLSLYVSSDNYLNCTRQALSDILTWPNSWNLPHQWRAQAKKRSEHLGLSSLDVDSTQEENKKADAGLTAHIPKSLRKPKQTVTGLLGRNHQKNRFRLDAVTEDFFEPLSEMLGEKNWLLGEQASSADCLAIGYLALMQTPALDHEWLRESLQTKHTNLDQWAKSRAAEMFGPPVDASWALGRTPGFATAQSPLPWRVPASRSLSQVLQAVVDGCISSIPALGSLHGISEIGNTRGAGRERYREKQLQLARLQRQRDMYLGVVASTVTTMGLVAWLVYQGLLPMPRWGRSAPRRRGFGEAGVLLGL
ncbi:uncharacterized protein Z520_05820 [Fonsecaea multimorphosa CBS 102226]|uniref:Mitochondrial outer membrane transport complex Sam37/metaxin N-terminal domain-containing protein n=1 Tax=Fonsecaea multimorphosa CBS 102226 TaxID=1442371 RepID=A0A0D2K5T2_9EURO|nr:uncharacterized protein Z520_05820 [Fonsecaea multimorphosa CBS 102226]KIX98519.1 hypothetical protein Z520_05820 [Fonsecaea multimorphosa CBS 102226]OAL24713.1 hypothetical protein AYO22_05502 [Fonsecaea multimorphosa]